MKLINIWVVAQTDKRMVKQTDTELDRFARVYIYIQQQSRYRNKKHSAMGPKFAYFR